MDDTALLEQLIRNRSSGMESLVAAYQDRLYRFALRLCGSPHDAEEIAQDAFVRAFAALREYPAERIRALSLRPWLYQVTVNVFRNRVRKRRVATVQLDGHVEVEDGGEPIERGVELAEQARDLRRLLTLLPERYRVAVVLRHIEELDYSEIARALGQPEGTVKSNVHRGLHLLRDSMSQARIEVSA